MIADRHGASVETFVSFATEVSRGQSRQPPCMRLTKAECGLTTLALLGGARAAGALLNIDELRATVDPTLESV
jgi:hypothetical protein